MISQSTQPAKSLRIAQQVVRDLVHNCVGQQGFVVRAARFQAQVFQHGLAGEFTLRRLAVDIAGEPGLGGGGAGLGRDLTQARDLQPGMEEQQELHLAVWLRT